ncbi:hypothetical protein [Chryseobacterium sp.]|jgi:hypothetical protein|uniref:hypothetical protein n=1 Tax=Chryseobacterium sp. TaxID=1871047 RepID=UPI00284C9CD1|nr:hypothetical protein [Chryseobacterium sp.]MDR3026014.1 hypothetical protein [Chryseobacterium sp.]
MGVTKLELDRLKDPLPLKWRVKGLIPDNINPTHMVIVGYIDARQVYDRLDKALGAGNWQEDYFECKGKQFCKIGIKVYDEWIWKGDSGIESFADPSKGETSDSVKRAAVHWGINREVYELGEITIKCKMDNGYPAPCDEAGNILKGDQILAECKRIASGKSELIFDKNVLPRTINNATVKPEEKKPRRKKTEPKIIMP